MTDRIQAAQTDEEYVRARCRVEVRDVGSGDWEIWIGGLCIDGYSIRGNDARQAWQVTREWVVAREEKIAELREEIAVLGGLMHGVIEATPIGNRNPAIVATFRRIVIAEEQRLAALLKGWREQDGGKG